jgi:hypothetical protein
MRWLQQQHKAIAGQLRLAILQHGKFDFEREGDLSIFKS